MTTLTFPTSESEQALLDRYAQNNAEYLRMLYDCGHVEFRSGDIPLADAMISYNIDTKRMVVLRHPEDYLNGKFDRLNMCSDIGASWWSWRAIPTQETMHKLWNLLVELHLDHGWPLPPMLNALDVIPEWRAMRKHAHG